METFIVIGVCFLCYELCEFIYQCAPRKKEDTCQDAAVVYTVSGHVEQADGAEAQ